MPPWFTSALDHKPEHTEIDVDGCRIHLRTWGRSEQPPVVFVHGGGAHSGWWDHIAPLFLKPTGSSHPSLSGHGDSGTHTTYHIDTWAREIMATAAAAGPSGRPTIVGHSMGGWITARAAQNYGEQIDSMVVIDSPLRNYAPEEARLRNRNVVPPGTGRRMRFSPDSRRCPGRRRCPLTLGPTSLPSRCDGH